MNGEPRKSRVWLRTLLLVGLTAAVAAPLGAFFASPAPAPSAQKPAAQYHCPMHPSVVSDHPGECPICGMKLVKIEDSAATPVERKVRFYRSPMDPRQTSPVPAKDSMGMDYLPVYEDEAGSTGAVEGMASVEIDPTRQQLIGLRTAAVDRGPVGGSFRTVGRLSVDETRVRRINVKVPGYVERIFVDFVGKSVRKGQSLFALYSPEVLAAEGEYLTALRAQSASLIAAARRKLELWDVSETEINRLEKEGTPSRAVTFVSPVNGVVTRKDVVEGARLEAGAMPYEIVDLSTLWVLADVSTRPSCASSARASARASSSTPFPAASSPGKCCSSTHCSTRRLAPRGSDSPSRTRTASCGQKCWARWSSSGPSARCCGCLPTRWCAAASRTSSSSREKRDASSRAA